MGVKGRLIQAETLPAPGSNPIAHLGAPRRQVVSESMHWSRQLSEPIILKDGRVIATLAEARAFIFGLSDRRQAAPYWQYAAELLLRAATRGGKDSMREAWAQLRRPPVAEGKL